MPDTILPLSNDTKEEIIKTQPNGIWLVLNEELQEANAIAEDLF
jgi:hypothetical protein